MWIVSLPVQVAIGDPTPAGLGALAWAGVAVWALGFAFEAVGDLQLSRFKADPVNRGKVMDRGLWRYTRHPNYLVGDLAHRPRERQRLVDAGRVRAADPSAQRLAQTARDLWTRR